MKKIILACAFALCMMSLSAQEKYAYTYATQDEKQGYYIADNDDCVVAMCIYACNAMDDNAVHNDARYCCELIDYQYKYVYRMYLPKSKLTSDMPNMLSMLERHAGQITRCCNDEYELDADRSHPLALDTFFDIADYCFSGVSDNLESYQAILFDGSDLYTLYLYIPVIK